MLAVFCVKGAKKMIESGPIRYSEIQNHLEHFEKRIRFLGSMSQAHKTLGKTIIENMKKRFVSMAQDLLSEGTKKAFERYDFGAKILLQVEEVARRVCGKDRTLIYLASQLQDKGREIENWLIMRRDEHPTWVPDVTPALLDVIDKSLSIFSEFDQSLEDNSLIPTVQLIDISQDILKWLIEDPERMYQMTPEAFEFFIMDRLKAMGMEVRKIGNIYRRDGGIDIIAWPNIPLSYLLGVQVKHHTKQHYKTGPREVRELVGAIAQQPFAFGLLVTNTTFTPNAHWVAQHADYLVRLRDFNDLKRWIIDDFSSDLEWREIPVTLTLAPGVEIKIRK
jgi:hypothetical protein